MSKFILAPAARLDLMGKGSIFDEITSIADRRIGVKMAAEFLKAHADGTYLMVKLQPRASKTELGPPLGNELKIKVTAPPVDAAANQALIDLLAQTLGCARSAVQIVRGQTSRHKTVWIAGLGVGDILKKLPG